MYVQDSLQRIKKNRSGRSKLKGCGGGDGGEENSEKLDGKCRKSRSDVSDSEGGRRKNGPTRDYLDTIKKTSMVVAPRKIMALPVSK